MSFTPGSDPIVNPSRSSFTQLQPFRFWCQKVLPAVYDDTLSYYELLCKVVDYLNKTMEDVDHMSDDFNNLITDFTTFENNINGLYNELVQYVNDYFDNLDVQEEINAKLDAMVTSGELVEILEPGVAETITDWLNEHITPTTPAIDSSLTIEGAGADSKTVGNNVRSIITDLAKSESGLQTFYSFGNWEVGGIAWSDATHTALRMDYNKRYQIGNITDLVFDRPVTLLIDSSYRVVMMEKVDGVYYDRGYKTGSYTVAANRPFCIAITLIDSPSGTIADIPTYLKAVTFKTNYQNEIEHLMDAPLIPVNTDLNTLLNSGMYRINEGATNAPPTWNNNFPAYLQVIKTKDAIYTVQLFIDLSYNHIQYYVRNYSMSPPVWGNWFLIYDKAVLDSVGTVLDAALIPVNTDINTLLDSGMYRVNSGAINGPEYWNNYFPSYVEVIKTKNAIYTVQIFYDLQSKVFYTRHYGGSPAAWTNWELIYNRRDIVTMLDAPLIPVDSDINTYLTSGMYRVNTGAINAPDYWSNYYPSYVEVIKTKNALYTVQIFYDLLNKVFYTRRYADLTWSPWELIYEKPVNVPDKNNIISKIEGLTYNAPAFNNEGITYTFLSYNVAHYNNDTNIYMDNEKRHNFKEMLSTIHPDFICLQESEAYIDGSNGSKNTMQYLFQPVFPYTIGTGSTQILSKINFTSAGQVKDGMGRILRYGIYTINNKKMLICSIHTISRHNNDITIPVDSAESIADRKTEYQDIIRWANHAKQLPDYYSDTLTSSPAWDYCIICGDFNSITDADKTNLLTEVNQYSMYHANGGWLDWLETNRNKSGDIRYSVDNVICSPNIIINSITAHSNMYLDLYSDHYPFEVNVTLTE